MTNKKLRVWWVPQVPMQSFYIPVESPEEGKKIMDVLAAYDCFQYNHNVKPDYCNMGGLQYYNEEDGEWEDWYFEDGEVYYDNLDEYIEEQSDRRTEIAAFAEALFKQVHFD